MDSNSYMAFNVDAASRYACSAGDAQPSIQPVDCYKKNRSKGVGAGVLLCSTEEQAYLVEVDDYKAGMPSEAELYAALEEIDVVVTPGDTLLSALPIKTSEEKPIHFLVSLVNKQQIVDRLKVLAGQKVYIRYVVSTPTVLQLAQKNSSCPEHFVFFDMRAGMILVFSDGKIIQIAAINAKQVTSDMFKLKLKTLLQKYEKCPLYWLGATDDEQAQAILPVIEAGSEISIVKNKEILSQWGIASPEDMEGHEITQVLAASIRHDGWEALTNEACFAENRENLPKKIKIVSTVLMVALAASVLVIIGSVVLGVTAKSPDRSSRQAAKTKKLNDKLRDMKKKAKGYLFLKPEGMKYQLPLFHIIGEVSRGNPGLVWVRYINVKNRVLTIGATSVSPDQFKKWLKILDEKIKASNWQVAEDKVGGVALGTNEEGKKGDERIKKIAMLTERMNTFKGNALRYPTEKDQWTKRAAEVQKQLDVLQNKKKKDAAFSVSSKVPDKRIQFLYKITATLSKSQGSGGRDA